MAQYKYRWTRQYAVPAQVAGPIIQECGSADAVLEEAHRASSPLHPLFEWNDTRAAQQYRLVQARCMINSLQVEVITHDRKVQHIAAFVTKVDKTGFVPTLEADVEQMSGAEEQCLRHMRRFKARWKGLQFARDVVAVINDKELHAQRRGPKRATRRLRRTEEPA